MGGDADLRLFSITSSGYENEQEWQREVAEFNHALWYHRNIEESGGKLLPRVVQHCGIPAVAWNNLAQFELAGLAAENGVTVFLNGQGADEIFGGYPDYLQRDWWSLAMHLFKFRNNLPLSYGEIVNGWLKFQFKKGIPENFLKQWYWRSQAGWLSEEMCEFSPYLWKYSHLSADEKMQQDYFGQKLSQMLRWEDLNGMAHSLESRNPFADDQTLAAWLKVPFGEKIKNGFTKGVLRDAAADLVPEKVRWRRDKKGFSVPDSRLTWQAREDWKAAFLSSALDPYSPRAKREKMYQRLHPEDHETLRWYFRLSSLAYFMENLQNES